MAKNNDSDGEMKQSVAPGSVAVSPFTAEVIMEMRRRGLPRPAEVSEERWNASTPAPLHMVRERVQQHLYENPPSPGDKSAYGIAFPEAMDTMLEVMTDPTESGKTRLAAAMHIADKHTGKAEQVIEHKGSFIHEFRKQISVIEASFRNVGETAAKSTIAKPVDTITASVDSFLQTHVTADFSVGKRVDTSGEDSE